jgi:hypothetical protein
VVWGCKEHQTQAGEECQGCLDQGELFTRADAADLARQKRYHSRRWSQRPLTLASIARRAVVVAPTGRIARWMGTSGTAEAAGASGRSRLMSQESTVGEGITPGKSVDVVRRALCEMTNAAA